MSKFMRGDLLIFTNRGLIRMDSINENDLILTSTENGYSYEAIEEITKIFKNKYYLNKINFYNNIDSYYLNDNIDIKAVQNIPLNLEIQEMPVFLDNSNPYKYLTSTSVGDLSSFDYVSFPTNFTTNEITNEITNDDYRFQGILLASSFIFNEEKHKETITFITTYLTSKEIDFNLEKEKSIIKISINEKEKAKIILITLKEVINASKEQLKSFVNGINEITNEIIINNKKDFYLIKYAYLSLGVIVSSYINNGIVQIKVPRKITSYYHNYFNYNNQVHNKIKSIKKSPMKGFIYSLKLKNNNPYLTDIGLIS